MKEKQHLDVLVFQKGLALSKEKASAMIMAGLVLVDEKPSNKPGVLVNVSSKITLKEKNPYVSRGALKIKTAFDAFNLSVEGKVCMDIGASTGGFTDFMLKKGAKLVYAVDVGKGLLDFNLSKDKRVVNMEGVNFRFFPLDCLKEPIEFVTIDVSFISLEKILPIAHKCLKNSGLIVALVKPQFEAERGETVKGVVKDHQLRLAIIERIKEFSKSIGFDIVNGVDSDIKGPKGNLEHLLLLKKV